MPREARLIRRVLATAGDWAGDAGPGWSEGSPPVSAIGNGTETTDPIMTLPIYRREGEKILTRGAAGMMRVVGGDASRRFNMQIFVEWKRIEKGQPPVSDWRLLTGSAAQEIGDGEDFTTDPIELLDSRIAFHLIPIGGSLVDGSTVEIWSAEI